MAITIDPDDTLRFAVSDRINDAEVGPKFVPLSLLGDFQRDVSEFLRGSSKEIDPASVIVSVEEGSFAIVASGLRAASTLWSDLQLLSASASLSEIDSKRAIVIERWQTAARQHPHRKYAVLDNLKQVRFSVDATTMFARAEEIWLTVEKHLSGRVIDMGGKTRPNIHLELDGGGLVMIAAAHDLLAREERNRVYRHALLHITVEENLMTGAVRNPKLLAFEPYSPTYDENEFKEMVRHGTEAWSDVPNATDWVEELRGGRS